MCQQNNTPQEPEENVEEASAPAQPEGEVPAVEAQTEGQEQVEETVKNTAEELQEGKKTVKEKKKKSVKKIILRTLLIILLVLLFLVVAAVVTVLIMRCTGRASLKVDDFTISPPTEVEVEYDPVDDTLVYYKGGKYKLKEDIAAFVVMGVDKEDINDVIGAGDNGQADAVFLVVADPADGSVDMVSISRDSLTEVDRYTTTGRRDGSEVTQLCLAYAYGDGKETSCENVKKSVSRLFYGIPISRYVAIDLDAISVLTDEVGGVSVPEYNSDMVTKTGKNITVSGDMAERYLRRRNIDKLDSNNARMERQNYFLNAFISKVVSETKKDISTPVNIYNALSDYMVTDVTADAVVYLATEYLGGVDRLEKHTVKGTVTEGEDGYAEFTPEPVALYELVLDLFYEKI